MYLLGNVMNNNTPVHKTHTFSPLSLLVACDVPCGCEQSLYSGSGRVSTRRDSRAMCAFPRTVNTENLQVSSENGENPGIAKEPYFGRPHHNWRQWEWLESFPVIPIGWCFSFFKKDLRSVKSVRRHAHAAHYVLQGYHSGWFCCSCFATRYIK